MKKILRAHRPATILLYHILIELVNTFIINSHNFSYLNKKLLLNLNNIPIDFLPVLCYNIDTKEREVHSNVQLKDRAFKRRQTSDKVR